MSYLSTVVAGITILAKGILHSQQRREVPKGRTENGLWGLLRTDYVRERPPTIEWRPRYLSLMRSFVGDYCCRLYFPALRKSSTSGQQSIVFCLHFVGVTSIVVEERQDSICLSRIRLKEEREQPVSRHFIGRRSVGRMG